jgi:hypothetical protein
MRTNNNAIRYLSSMRSTKGRRFLCEEPPRVSAAQHVNW